MVWCRMVWHGIYDCMVWYGTVCYGGRKACMDCLEGQCDREQQS